MKIEKSPSLTPKTIFEEGINRLTKFDVKPLLSKLYLANSGAIEDVENINGCAYYQWTCGIINWLKPSQVIELGGAMGVWTICVSHFLPKSSHLYSITLEEDGLDFQYIPNPPKNVHLIRGNDLEMENWKNVDLNKTDLWFIDTGIADDHFAYQLLNEMDLYSPYFKKGAVVLFDDIHKNEEMDRLWNEIKKGTWGKFDCYDATDPLHWSGFGIVVI